MRIKRSPGNNAITRWDGRENLRSILENLLNDDFKNQAATHASTRTDTLPVSAKGFPLRIMFKARRRDAAQETTADMRTAFNARISRLESSDTVRGRIFELEFAGIKAVMSLFSTKWGSSNPNCSLALARAAKDQADTRHNRLRPMK